MNDKLDFLYRMGLADERDYWKKRRLRENKSYVPVQPPTPPAGNENPMVVSTGIRGSMQDLLSSWLLLIAQEVVDATPRQYKSTSVQSHQPFAMAVQIYMHGESLDVIPVKTDILIELDRSSLRTITATVRIEDSVYDPRDYRNDVDTFSIDWTSPKEDLVGQIQRHLNSRRRNVGPRG